MTVFSLFQILEGCLYLPYIRESLNFLLLILATSLSSPSRAEAKGLCDCVCACVHRFRHNPVQSRGPSGTQTTSTLCRVP